MAEINSRTDLLQSSVDALRGRERGEENLSQLLKDIKKDRANAVELARMDPAKLPMDAKQQIGQMLAEQLRGQLPAEIAQALTLGALPNEIFAKVLQRFANANDSNPQNRFGQAGSPELARQMATDQSIPQQALNWTQFVQAAQHVPGSQLKDRHGSAGPKGEGTTLIEILGSRLGGLEGAGLRSPKLVDRALAELSPSQRATLMRATFGEKLAGELQRMGITDPLQLVRAGALPADRAALAAELGIPRGQLLALLMRAELLRIGPGRNGELGIRPELLGPLKDAGIAMLGTLAAVRALSQEELAAIYKKLRLTTGGFAKAMKGGRPIVKRDLLHWAKSAARRPSDIMLADREQIGERMNRSDAQELIQAWYLENLFWSELAQARRRSDDQERVRREEREQRQREREQQQSSEGEEDEQAAWTEEIPDMEYDDLRTDNLMCFWITDFNAHSAMSGIVRRMYVCIDPDTGAIIPQSVESEIITGR